MLHDSAVCSSECQWDWPRRHESLSTCTATCHIGQTARQGNRKWPPIGIKMEDMLVALLVFQKNLLCTRNIVMLVLPWRFRCQGRMFAHAGVGLGLRLVLYPILRTYTMFKTEFGSEKYIEAISDCRYRIAMTKLRSSSHTLEVERGRYTKPKTNICERLCPVCNVIEYEIHFLANCKLYDAERTHFFGKVTAKIQNLHELNDADKFILLMSSKDKQILVWTGKFIYECFNIRSRFYFNYCGVWSRVLYISFFPRCTDSAVAGANGGCPTMTASVGMMTNVQENCYLLCGFYLKFYWYLNDYLLSSSTVSHDFMYNAVPLTHCCLLCVTCMILRNALSEMTK